MKKGFELLRSRETKIDFDLLSQKGVTLPPKFKMFLNYFETGSFMDLFLYEKQQLISPNDYFLTSINSKNKLPIVDNLFNQQLLIEQNSDSINKEYLRVGFFGNEILLVGITENDEDILFKHKFNDRIDTDSNFEFIAKDIFEYIADLEEIEHSIKEKDKSLYYKNWGEDFWRVREE